MRHGFTLIEILIVMSIVVIMAAVSFPFYNLFQGFSATEAVTFEIKENLRAAQIKARSGESNTNFGLYFSAGQYTLYQGANYAGRTPSADQSFSLPANINIAGAADINFTKNTGLPAAAVSLTVTNTDTQSESAIAINSLGLIY